MSIFGFVSDLFDPVTKLLDTAVTSDEERLKLGNALAKIQSDLNGKLIELEKAKVDAMSKVQVAEANSKYAVVALWRPISSLAIVGIIILGSFEVVTVGSEIYDLASIFLGTYTASRGMEKIATTIKNG